MGHYLTSQVRRPLVAAALRQTHGAFLSIAVLSAVTNILMLVGPLFMMQIYDRVLTSRSVPTLVVLSILAVGIYLFLGVLELIRARILTEIGQRLEEELGASTFDAVMTLPLHMSKREAMLQPARDLDHVRQFMSGAGPIAICDLPWLPFFGVLLFLFHPYLGWLALAGAVILMVLTVSSELMLRAPMRSLSALSNARAEYLEAGRRNAEALHAMGMRGAYAARWNGTNGRYINEHRWTSKVTGNFTTASKIFRLALQSAVLALGAWLAIRQEISGGAMIAASILTSKALAPIEQAIGQWRSFLQARQAKGRLQDILEKLAPGANPMPLPAPRHSISVSNLSVTAPGIASAIVQDVTFSLQAGQAVGVIGPSGSGKSTLARALVGLWKPLRGTIRLDGAEIDQWNPEVLGGSIGYLPQGVELFDGTVAENIARFSASADPQDIIAAAQLAGAHDLILSLPDGYDTQIGSNGAVLSAGQRQRVGLARALYGNPFLVVLDEPNASLDSEGEISLNSAIATVRERGAAVIVIAHRRNALSAVSHAMVLAQGRVAAFGHRDEVLRKTTIRAAGG